MRVLCPLWDAKVNVTQTLRDYDMSRIILPFQRNAQISDKETVCVLVHRETKRILTFCRNDPFSKSFESSGYELIELKHASDYDRYCRMFRDQAMRESEAEDYAYLVREEKSRNQLAAATDYAARQRC
jgi:hypothetical protein